mmetsp:Transcript_1856/g.3797  ORF Transcript_1856/g.3797 Transcript_1856/m.3797 type:complete len:309 (+) Transcript_1856:1199-2125(+)
MHARGAEAARLCELRVRVRLARDGGVCADPRGRDLHPDAPAAADQGAAEPPQARRAHRRPQPAAACHPEHGVPEVLAHGPEPLHTLRAPRRPLHRAQPARACAALDRDALQLALQGARRHAARFGAPGVPGGERRLRPRVPDGRGGGPGRGGRERADGTLLPEPCRGRVRRRRVHVHAPHRLPRRQDHPPRHLQRPGGTAQRRGDAAVCVAPCAGDAAQDRDGGQVPGAAERLHPALARAHQDDRASARRAASRRGALARAPRRVRVRPRVPLLQLHRALTFLPDPRQEAKPPQPLPRRELWRQPQAC